MARATPPDELFKGTPIQRLFEPLWDYLNYDHDDGQISSGFIIRPNYAQEAPAEIWMLSWSAYEPSKEKTDLMVADNYRDRYSMFTNDVASIDMLLPKVTDEYLAQHRMDKWAAQLAVDQLIDGELRKWFDAIDVALEENLAFTELAPNLRRYFLTVDHDFQETVLMGIPVVVIFKDPSTFFKVCLAKTLAHVDKVNRRIDDWNTMVERFGIAQFTVICEYIHGEGFSIKLHATLDTATTREPTEVSFDEAREALYAFQPPRDAQDVSQRKQQFLLNLHQQDYFQVNIVVRVMDNRATRSILPYLRENRRDLETNYKQEHLVKVPILFAFAPRGISLYNQFTQVMRNYGFVAFRPAAPNRGYGDVYYPFLDVVERRRTPIPQSSLFEERFEMNFKRGLDRFFLTLFETPMVFTRNLLDKSKLYTIDEESARDAIVPEDRDADVKVTGFYYHPTQPTSAKDAEYYKKAAPKWVVQRKQNDHQQAVAADRYRPSAFPREKYLPSTADFAYHLALMCPVQLERGYVPEFELWDITTMKPFDRTLYR